MEWAVTEQHARVMVMPIALARPVDSARSPITHAEVEVSFDDE